MITVVLGSPSSGMSFSLPRFAVALPLDVPHQAPVRRFVDAAAFNAYVSVWRSAGYRVAWDGPYMAAVSRPVSL